MSVDIPRMLSLFTTDSATTWINGPFYDFSSLWYDNHWEERLPIEPVTTVIQVLSRVWLCDPRDCSTSGFPVLHYLLESAQICDHWVGDAIKPSYPLSPPSPPAFSLSQHQGLFKWVSSSHQVAKVLEFQLCHQSFQWIFRTDFL